MTLDECGRMRAHADGCECMRANANYNDSSSSNGNSSSIGNGNGNGISSDSFNPTPSPTIEASPLTRLKRDEEHRRIQRRTISKAYYELAETGTPTFALSECIGVVELFMFEYSQHFGKPHPFLNAQQFQDVIIRLPSVDSLDLEPLYYDIIIRRYFEQRYAHCNYHIFHFLSGKIRLNLFYKFCI